MCCTDRAEDALVSPHRSIKHVNLIAEDMYALTCVVNHIFPQLKTCKLETVKSEKEYFTQLALALAKSKQLRRVTLEVFVWAGELDDELEEIQKNYKMVCTSLCDQTEI